MIEAMRPHDVGSDPPRPPPASAYFLLAFVWTWSLWWTAAATGASVADAAGGMLYMAGGLGPLVAVVGLLMRRDRAYRRDFLRRVWDPRGITAPWWWALAAVAFGPALVGAIATAVAGSAAVVPPYGIAAVASTVGIALLAGFAEEPGWRGVASDAWQRSLPPAWAGAAIGGIWALWHLPLAFIDGTYYHALGFGSLEYWLTNLALVLLGVLYLWLANGGRHAILLAALAHAGFNVGATLAPRSTVGDLTALLSIAAAALVVVTATRGRLGYPPNG